MSKLKDLVSRGVRLIVTDAPADGAPPAEGAEPREREIPPEAFAEAAEPRRVTRSEVPADVTDFSAVYGEAAIELPAHGYGIDKVAEMLEGKRLASLGREVKATAVMAAIEAAGVPLRDVIQDAVRRDKALDAFEAAKGREIQELHARTETRIQEIQAEIQAFLKERNAELERLKAEEEAANRAFLELQTRKRREEERLAFLVGHFLEGGSNPISTPATGAADASAPSKPDRAS
jgi:DNA-binding PucR family transcriptional regulator